MADIFDYLKWRGDISFSKMPPNPVDALILSTLSYISFDEIVPTEVHRWVLFKDVADKFLMQSNQEGLVRVKKDIELITEMAMTERFRNIGMSFYKNILLPEEETQFSAISFLLDDGSAFLIFRGTDKTLTGWKEDFNMSFLESVPAQRMALQYLQEFCESSECPIRLGGHSKGGNLAIYAAVKSGSELQKNILEVYNHDGPGFTDNLMGTDDYINLVPKIHTYVPQSSLVGMLLEHEEPYMVIKSHNIGVMQHDPYSWEVIGPDFVYLEEVTSDAQYLDKMIKRWMKSMTPTERDEFIDTVFEIMESEGIDTTDDIIKPKNLIAYFKTLHSDEEIRKVLAKEVVKLVRAAGINFSGAKNKLKEIRQKIGKKKESV